MTGNSQTPWWEEADGDHSGTHFVLRLYVTGSTPRSTRAVEIIRRVCEERLNGRYDLEVIDIYQNPQAARDAQIIAAPTLVKILPEPLRRIIGDLSNSDRVLAGLNLVPATSPPGGTQG
ncbi:circadian clock KaiB family protein [Pseudohoeflea coraliihabitans]|uniref:Circadian clock KaiB family protein n=1 Tax=Pseudohoeflea coraliihabitans TaxID=2860393 RepID=A0ABS6WN75_9HYPH|nr:circadian clock KaiB family protein [Pseudohoeflea sp. DP4N28-3]MBW3097404.1 circadian clock KaiB family protein [Pseudohoeflea sp. DP4N28-3]